MELEFQQIELKFEHLRRQRPGMERRLLASLASEGQLMPVVVLPQDNGRYLLLDGYKRVRGLQKLQYDTVMAVLWDLCEVEALLLEQVMRNTEPEGALEQGWFLRELRDRFNVAPPELARRFDKTPSWVSRRLALVEALPEQVQDLVRLGRIKANIAMKVLVPLSRVNRRDCLRFCEMLEKADFTTREALELQKGWQQGTPEVRERILADPLLYLKTQQVVLGEKAESGPFHQWLEAVGAIAGISRRAKRDLKRGALLNCPPGDTQEALAALRQASADFNALSRCSEKDLNQEQNHA
jgi:ParB family transcriptional regulator, chromosome partitioning protein